MNTTSRRNLASLVFIAVLALIYLAVFLITESNNHDNEISIEKTESPIVAPIDSTATQASAPTGKKKRKKASSQKQRTPKAPEPDRPDIFDRPVNKISDNK